MSRSTSDSPSIERREFACEWEEAFARLKPSLLGALFLLLDGDETASRDAFETLRASFAAVERAADASTARTALFRALYLEATRRRATASVETQPRSDDANDESGSEIEEARRAILSLSFDERSAFLLRQNGELTLEQTAAATDRTTQETKSLLSAAVKKLSRALANASERRRAQTQLMEETATQDA